MPKIAEAVKSRVSAIADKIQSYIENEVLVDLPYYLQEKYGDLFGSVSITTEQTGDMSFSMSVSTAGWPDEAKEIFGIYFNNAKSRALG